MPAVGLYQLFAAQQQSREYRSPSTSQEGGLKRACRPDAAQPTCTHRFSQGNARDTGNVASAIAAFLCAVYALLGVKLLTYTRSAYKSSLNQFCSNTQANTILCRVVSQCQRCPTRFRGVNSLNHRPTTIELNRDVPKMHLQWYLPPVKRNPRISRPSLKFIPISKRKFQWQRPPTKLRQIWCEYGTLKTSGMRDHYRR